jgi:hypothetical protein
MISRPSNIEEALKLPLEELANCGDYMGVLISQIKEDEEDIEKLMETQFKVDRSSYDKFNITSLGSTARIIVSGQNKILVSRAQEIYDDYVDWYKSQYSIVNMYDQLIKFLNPIFLK